MRARLVDWSLFVLVMLEVVSGYYSFTVGKPQDAWFFWAHGIVGLAILLLLLWKVKRVWGRIVDRRLWDRATVISLIALALVLLAIGSGVLWSGWQIPLGYPNGLNLHVVLGTLLALAMSAHMILRFKPLQRRHFEGRRTLARYLLVVASGVTFWTGQQGINRALVLPGSRRRFTGSREVGSGEGIAFPITMWMFDNPAPLDLDDWRLRITGAVNEEYLLNLDEIARMPERTLTATLDCTGGWYTEQRWRGIAVADLLARARPTDTARHVSFVSATGYRWSIPLHEAEGLLLATHAGDDALDHGRGAPLRLVAPGRRGFQWVKWVVEVRVLEAPDPGQWGAIFASGLGNQGG